MIEKWIYEKLKANIGKKRYEHSLNVMEVSIDLARLYGQSVEKAAIAGLLHDCGKLQDKNILLKLSKDFDIILNDMVMNNKELLHGPLGKELAKKEYHIYDEKILNAIRYHTTGREKMDMIEKIVYIADLIEPNRDFPDVEIIRRLAYKDINKSLLYSMENTIKFLIHKQLPIHLDTIRGRNWLLNFEN